MSASEEALLYHSTVIELSASAVRRNIRFLKRRMGQSATFCSVIKANAYGHGIKSFVPLVEACGVKVFAVFSADEAEEVLACRTRDSHVIIMGTIDDDALAWAVENGVAFFVYGTSRLDAALQAAKKIGRQALIHLEVETGLNRMGLKDSGLNAAVRCLQAHGDWLNLEGVCTHLAGAESVSNYVRIQRQIQKFLEFRSSLTSRGAVPTFWHVASSAAALTYPETVMDMVRFGIAQYGFWPSKETELHVRKDYLKPGKRATADPLRRVISWKSRVMNVKAVGTGEFVGYGNSYLTTRPERVASVPVGYSHGFPRALSNVGNVLIRGKRCRVVGLVGMNIMMVDVTDNKEVQRGDEVVLVGKQGKREITVGSFSDLTRLLNYEVLARLCAKIPRVVVP